MARPADRCSPHAMGFDIGGTKVEVVVIDAAGAEMFRRREPTPRAYDDLVALVRTLVFDTERAVAQACTVGIGAPGSPNPATGLHRNSNLTSMNGRPFQADICAAVGRPVCVSNDANCMTLSEATDGAAFQALRAAGVPLCGGNAGAVVFGVILGTGIGGGVVVGTQVVEGRNGVAGEWGHNPMPGEGAAERDGPVCYCGRRGCIEQYLAGPAIAARYEALSGRAVTAYELVALADAGDAHARSVLTWHTGALARALAGVVNTIDPCAIVLAGGLSNIPGIAQGVQAALAQHVFSDACATPVVRALHGDSSGVRGAAWLGAGAGAFHETTG